MTTIIKLIFPTETITYTENEIIKNYVRGSQVISDASTISFEVCSQYGSCVLYDKNKVILGKIQAGTLTAESIVPCELYLDSTLIGKYEAEIEYDIIKNYLNIELYDSLARWTNIKYNGFTYDDIYKSDAEYFSGKTEAEINGYMLYNKLKADTIALGVEYNWKTIPLEIINAYFLTVTLKVPYLECETLLEAWNNFCLLMRCAIFKNESGEIEVLIYE